MKRSLKQTLALLLCLIMIAGIIPVGIMNTSAAKNAIDETISSILNEYPNNSYFSVDGKACNHGDGYTCNNCHLTHILKSRKIPLDKYNHDGHTCWSFTSYVFTRIYGKSWVESNYIKIDSDGFTGVNNKGKTIKVKCHASDKTKRVSFTELNNSSMYDFFKQAKKGDIIAAYKFNGEKHIMRHFMVFLKCDSTGIYVYDSNVGGNKYNTGHVSYNRLVKYSDMANSSFDNIEIHHAKNYDETTGSVSQPKYSTKSVENGIKVTLTTPTKGSEIHYTTDGTNPTKNSPLYSDTFKITKTTTVKAKAFKSGLTSSDILSKKITVNKTETPTINYTTTSTGFKVTISGEKGSTIYYTTDGTKPSSKSTKYTGAININENIEIKAFATKSGQANSSVVAEKLQFGPLEPPVLTLISDNVIGVGDYINLKWTSVPCAFIYGVTINGQQVENPTETSWSFVAEQPGEYVIQVDAWEQFSISEPSNSVKVTVKPDVTVTFKDYDGKVISKQIVHYGKDATAPTPTSKTGFTFNKWNGKYTNVKQDTVVTAEYSPVQYTINFVDESGKTVIYSENVDFGSSVKSIPDGPVKSGYNFVGWSLKPGSDGTSYTNVDGSAIFEPVYTWSNPDTPIGVTIVSAKKTSDSYTITSKVTNNSNKPIYGKMIAVVKTANDKIVAQAINQIQIPANATNKEYSITINSKNKAMLCEVYIVGNEDEICNDRTGGALSEKASCAVTIDNSAPYSEWSDWSAWSEEQITSSATTDVETKKQYRYSDYQTTTSNNSTLDGWTYVSVKNEYGSYSKWKTSKITSSETLDVQSKKVYRYYYYACGSCGNRQPYWDTSCTKCGKYVDGNTREYFWSDKPYSSVSSKKYDSYKRVTTDLGDGKKWYFSSGNLNDTKLGTIDASGSAEVILTGYRSRKITKVYTFERWTAWSEWNDIEVGEISGSRNVQTRTLYRYRNLETQSENINSSYNTVEDLSGKAYNISGNLNGIENDYTGKIATILVYKGKNSDATESQLEYVGQTTIGSNNSYSFSFIPREEISETTGDYIVSFSIATATRLVNYVEVISAPKTTYKVEFKDFEGNILSTQNVAYGETAIAPDMPQVEGYTSKWNKTFTNISANTTITQQLEAKPYSVIFVDFENDEIISIQEVLYGETPSYPSEPSAEGMEFVGWSHEKDEPINNTTIISAEYTPILYNVNFLNKDGSVFETQKVAYGSFADLPENSPEEEGFEFISWDAKDSWWNIQSDININPIFVYDKTAEAPVITNSGLNIGNAIVLLETSTDEGEIHYTLDGTEPTEEDLIFDDFIFVEETVTLKAKTFKSGMNSSCSVEETIEVHDETDAPSVEAITNVSQYKVGETTASICMKINNPLQYTIKSYGYYLSEKSTSESKTYENTSINGSTEKVIGKVFNLTGLKPDTTYTYDFYVTLEFNGEELYYSSASGSLNVALNEFTTTGVNNSNPTSNAKIYVASAKTIDYKSYVTIKATATGVPSNYYLAIYVNDKQVAKGTNTEVTYDAGQVTSDINYTVKVVDANGNVQKDANGKDLSKDGGKITCNAGFFKKLVAFFKGLFGKLPVITIKP